MKELGNRTEVYKDENGGYHGDGFVIVELTDAEFAALEKLLEERDIPQEVREKTAWGEQFKKDLEQITLSARVAHRIRWATRWGDFQDDHGRLLSFREWAKAVLEGYEKHGKKGCYRWPLTGIRNFGVASYLELVEALKAAGL